MDLLSQLVDKSLVVAEQTAEGPPRYRLLESLRQYAAEKLAECTEAEAARDRHARYYLAYAETAELEILGHAQMLWVERLHQEHDNLRAALRWLAEQGESEAELRLSGSLWRFWYLHSHLSEGRRWLEAALARGSAAPAAARAIALFGLGGMRWALGEVIESRPFAEESLALYRELGDKAKMGDVLCALAITAAFEGDLERASACSTEALGVSREAGFVYGTGIALGTLGIVAQVRGDDQQGAALYRESLAVLRGSGDREGTAHLVEALARVVHGQGRLHRAAALYRESLGLFEQTGDRRGIARCLDGLAGVAAAQNQWERAARLLAAQEALRERIGFSLLPHERAVQEQAVAATRAGLGEQRFGLAWADGRAMLLDQAVAYALGVGEPVHPTASAASPPSLLTQREQEVAGLVARGLSNPDIAATLVIAPGTAQRHVANILGKLGFTSRAQIAVWAAQHGLLPPAAD